MKAVGEVMSIGKNYKEALQKAIRSLEKGRYGLGFAKDFHELPLDELYVKLAEPTSCLLYTSFASFLNASLASRRILRIATLAASPFFFTSFTSSFLRSSVSSGSTLPLIPIQMCIRDTSGIPFSLPPLPTPRASDDN